MFHWKRYDTASYDAKRNAQANLRGRTHFADDEILGFFKSRIVLARSESDGLLFALVESCALDYENTRRGFRYAIFDTFGNVISRPSIEQAYKSRAAASKAMREVLDTFDALAINKRALADWIARNEREAREIAEQLDKESRK